MVDWGLFRVQGYRAFGLHFLSEIEIPGAMPVPLSRTAEADWVITTGAGPAPVRAQQPYTLRDGSLSFDRPGAALYQCDGQERRIVVQAHAGASPREIAAHLIATALPAALWMEGRIVLHAAAAVMPGSQGAFAIAGASGAGKSTLLAQMVHDGALCVGEDSIAIRECDGDIRASGLPGCVLLRPSNAHLNDQRDVLTLPAAQQLSEAALSAFVILRTSDDRNGFERLHGAVALQALLQQRHRATIPRMLGCEPQMLPQLLSLANVLPIYRWHAPRTQMRKWKALHTLAEA